MNRTLAILLLLLSVLFTACQSDEPAIDEGGGKTDGKDLGYIAVSIVQPKSVTGRAGTDDNTPPDGFEYGTEVENTATEALFFIFSTDGKTMYGNAQRVPIKGTGTDDTHAVERIYDAVLIIDGAGTDPTSSAKQVVCVLNAPDKLENNVTKLEDLTGPNKVSQYGASTSGTFIMSNSVYFDGDTKHLGTIVDGSKIKKSASEAVKDPVEVYVERIVAKVRAKAKTGTGDAGFQNTGAHPVVDGETKNLTINVTGIEIANIAETSNLLKNIDNITWPSGVSFTDKSGWNAPNYFRSYWEVTPTTTYGNKSYENIAEKFSSLADINLQEYIQPNTNQNQKTAILVTAQLMDENTPANLVYIRGGYTTNEGALALVAQFIANQGYFKKTSAEGVTPVTYSQLGKDDFEWKNKKDDSSLSLESYEVAAQVKSSVDNIYKMTRDATTGKASYTSSSVTDVNDFLKSEDGLKYKARVYKDGKCYYFVNIDQSSVLKLADGKLEGVVRNHIYDLTLNSIGGVGVPVFDPTDVIIPETPSDTDLFYLAARINVLDWRLVTQGVNFGENDTSPSE